MKKKILFFAVIFSVIGTMLFAGGRKDNESRESEDTAGFQDSFDLDGKKTGKWNFYIEAVDRAGNVSRAGPDNIYNDPESDLPTVQIINPMPYMRVQGNLNLVGIANDDDGIGHVELVITRGRDSKGEELVRTRATGTDYWSYFLDTTNREIWTDGVYTVTVWAVDINGLSGDLSNARDFDYTFKPKQSKVQQVIWYLDRYKPEIEVTSHEVGELVSGRVRLRGTVADGNGIAGFAYSLDGGNRYTSVKPSEDRRSGNYNWEVDINSKTLEDGPAVIWLRGTDGMGSIGYSAHLLFINNIPPDVQIVYPATDAVLSGVFTVAGYASHPVGLKSLSWKAAKDGGEFELLPGNHWWSTEIDTRGSKDSNIEVEIRAEDVSGNVTVKKQRFKLNQNAGLPVVTLTSPTANAIMQGDMIVVKGTATDDEGIAKLFYSLNAGEPREMPAASGEFQFAIMDLAEGVYNLDVWAQDVSNIIGPKVQLKGITIPSGLAEPRIASFQTGSGASGLLQPFYSGLVLRLEARTRSNMEVAIKSATPITASSVQFGDTPPIQIKPGAAGRDGLMRATVQVPANLPSGWTKIELRTTDRAGREVIYPEYIFVNQTDPSVYSTYDENRRWFEWIRPNMVGGRIALLSGDDVLIGVANQPVSTASVSGPGAENIRVEVDEFGRVNLRAIREGSFGPLTLTAGPHSNTFSLTADFSGPQIEVREYPRGWVQTSVPFRFTVTSSNRITATSYSLDMGENWVSLGASTDVSQTVNIGNMEDGTITILVRAVNEAGKTSISGFSVLKDNTPPNAQVVMPIADYRVNGTIRMGFSIEEFGQLKSVTYSRGEVTRNVFNVNAWDKDYSPKFLEVLMDSFQMPLDNRMVFTFEDMAGNRSTVNRYDFVIAPEDDIPVVQIMTPLENEVITNDFIISGIMYDDDGIKNMQWRMDNGAWQTVDAQYGFSIFVPLSAMTDNEHTITVIAEDIYGVRSQPVTRGFRVSLAEPTGQMVYPRYDTVLRESVELRGTAADNNGIKKIEVSVDNGITYNDAYGRENWTYRFNTKILKDGAHVVFFRIWDNYDVTATYASMINVDNTPPNIVLDSPGDGFVSVGKAQVMGRIEDPNLENVSIEIRSLAGVTVRSDLRSRQLEPVEVVREILDFAGQPDGIYNMEIVARDKAGNISRTSRNIELARQTMTNTVEIFYPLDNEKMSGEFFMYGWAGGTDPAGTVSLRINGIDRAVADVDENGYYKFALDSEQFSQEINSVLVHSNFGGSSVVQSRPQNLIYTEAGPWITIDSFDFGQFAYRRPYLYGRTGYILSEEDMELLADRAVDKDVKDMIRTKTPEKTEISFDNGRSFRPTKKGKGRAQDYRFRLETGEMKEGMHYILVKTTMKNGEATISRMLVQVDKTPPVIRLISPEAGGRYNQEIAYSSTATDDVELQELTYHLRVGDKALYELPGFLQGLYFEAIIPPVVKQFWNAAPVMPFGGGATYTDVGMGLSFFDDNVKIQVQYGFLTQDLFEALGGTKQQPGGNKTVRYGGHVLGLKLLASVYQLQFGPLAGPDWEWLSATFALGANFSLFDLAKEGYTQSGERTWMSALLLQIEFPKVTIPDRKNFRTFSLFTEGQLWFVPTDVDTSKIDNLTVIIPHIILGVRLYIF